MRKAAGASVKEVSSPLPVALHMQAAGEDGKITCSSLKAVVQQGKQRERESSVSLTVSAANREENTERKTHPKSDNSTATSIFH